MKAQSFYHSKKWKRTRNSYITDDNYSCQVCHNKNKSKYNVVDHIILRRLLPESQWCDKTNLWTLCVCCNGIKQRLEHNFNDDELQKITKNEWQKLIKGNVEYCKGTCKHDSKNSSSN